MYSIPSGIKTLSGLLLTETLRVLALGMTKRDSQHALEQVSQDEKVFVIELSQ